jgi:glycosyltransferase involved in cell wall biosynthesis
MLDAASTGLPLVVSNRMGEPDRLTGNGKVYEENDVGSLVEVLLAFSNAEERRLYGSAGRRKMLERFSWVGIAQSVEADFFRALAKNED